MKNKFYIILLIIITSLSLTSCSIINNKNTASKTMTSYLLATNNKDYKKAYEHLSSQCKDKVSYDEYKDYQEQLSKIVLERNSTYENEQILDTWVNEDGIEFKNVTKVLEKQNMKVDYGNEIVSEKSESYRYLIKEGNDYKIIWSGLFTENYSTKYSSIAHQYLKKDKYKEAIEYSDKSLDIWSNNNEAYYVKAYSLYQLEEYEKAVDNVEKYISLVEDEEYVSKFFPSIYLDESISLGLSAGYDLKGMLLELYGDNDGAQEAYEYSICLNPENELAKDHLDSLKINL